jgi:hypothetical protein
MTMTSRLFRIFLLPAIVSQLVGCGGGGGGSGGGDGGLIEVVQDADSDGISDVNDPCPKNPSADCSGGSPSSPAQLSLGVDNAISNNVFYNYFQYTAQKDEKILVHATLTIPLSDQQKSRCGSSPWYVYDTKTTVLDSSMNQIDGVCGESLTFTFPESGTYVFHFEYPANGSGYFNAASIIESSAITSPTGVAGSPSAPKPLSLEAQNLISINTFYNYFKFTANGNDRIIISTVLNTPLTVQQKSRCGSSYDGSGPLPSSYDTQIHVYDASMNRIGGICGENLDFTFPAAGTYIFQFDFATQSAGYFNAAIIN